LMPKTRRGSTAVVCRWTGHRWGARPPLSSIR